ncbi:MAG: hypothetical protein NT011_05325 [Kiritimatiellaeota bacterium]|nr:hypothetical protein [Kiritimatiellota bacterium]
MLIIASAICLGLMVTPVRSGSFDYPAPPSSVPTVGDGVFITNWTWMKGSNTKNQFGIYGTQGVPDPANMPGAHMRATSWTDGQGAFWLFGGYGYVYTSNAGVLNDLWKFDPITTNWTWMKGSNTKNQLGTYGTQGVPDPANMPGARFFATSWTDGQGALWLFGGSTDLASSGILNDLWKFDPSTTNWTWMKGSNTTNQFGIYGTQGVPDPVNTPGTRYGSMSWTDGSGALWLFGGYGFSTTGMAKAYLSDLWKFDPSTTNWTWMKGSNTTNQLGIYGTQGVPDPANMPGAHYTGASWRDDSGALWLFGGYGYASSASVDVLNDLWKFDPITTNWTWMKGSTNGNQSGTYGTQGVPDPANMPGARHDMVSWTDGQGALWLFGGYGFSTTGMAGAYLSDLWKFDQSTTNWTWMKGSNTTNQLGIYGTQGVPDPANMPSAHLYAASWRDDSGAFWLFGGYGYASSAGIGILNDLWKYTMAGGMLIDTNELVFSATYKGFNPAAQMAGMSNVGAGTFTYTNAITYSAGASGWLTVLPSAETVAVKGAVVLTNQINIAGLGAGTYYATNRITSADTTNSPQIIVATLTVGMPPVAGDFDGDGLADPAMVDANGIWKVWLSGNEYVPVVSAIPLYVVGGFPVAGDFDGDGLADPAIVGADDVWTGWLSGNEYVPVVSAISLHVADGFPVAGDFDGDGKTDAAMRDADCIFWTGWLSNGEYVAPVTSISMHVADGLPVAGDFDGDGLADPAMVDTNGIWKVWLSGNEYVPVVSAIPLYVVGGFPVAGDFDGDGLADPAMVDANGVWKVWMSRAGYAPVSTIPLLP